jgi:hypothetical protein
MRDSDCSPAAQTFLALSTKKAGTEPVLQDLEFEWWLTVGSNHRPRHYACRAPRAVPMRPEGAARRSQPRPVARSETNKVGSDKERTGGEQLHRRSPPHLHRTNNIPGSDAKNPLRGLRGAQIP